MKRRKFHITIILIIAITIVAIATYYSCNATIYDEDKELRETADSFSTAFFNWQFPKACKYVADNKSKDLLSYAASQVSQEDVDSLKAMSEGAQIIIKDVKHNDSLSMVAVEVSNFLSMDSIGKPPHRIEKATFQIPVKQVNGYWKVALSELP